VTEKGGAPPAPSGWVGWGLGPSSQKWAYNGEDCEGVGCPNKEMIGGTGVEKGRTRQDLCQTAPFGPLLFRRTS